MLNRTTVLSMAMLLGASCLALSVPAGAQTITRSFDGAKGLSLKTCRPEETRCGRQPEMNAAVNGKQVVQVTWQDVNVYDYQGRLLQSTPMSDFVKKAGLDPVASGGKGPFEPHVVYDEFIGRWIVTVTCHDDCFIVSATSDPTGSWRGVNLSCMQGGPCLDRDPALHIGYDRNGVYYCGGHFGDDNPNTVPRIAYDCFALTPAETKAIGRGIAPKHLNRRHNMPLDVLPAIDNNPRKAHDAPAFFMAKTCSRAEMGGCQRSADFSFHWVVDTFTWNGSTGTYNAGGAEQVIQTGVGSKQNKWLYNLPCCGKAVSMPQKGSEIGLRTAESHRLNNLVQFGSHLEAVLGSGPCTANCGEQGTDKNNIMIWVDLNCARPSACVVAQTAKISGAEVNPVFGTVGVDNKGNVGIVAESSTASTDLSILLWTRRATDPPDTFRGPTTVISGTEPYTCLNKNGLALIASAVGILTARDPADGSQLWTSQQYSDTATPCVFETRIVRYRIDGNRAPASKNAKISAPFGVSGFASTAAQARMKHGQMPAATGQGVAPDVAQSQRAEKEHAPDFVQAAGLDVDGEKRRAALGPSSPAS